MTLDDWIISWIIAGGILVFLWRFYRAQDKLDWVKGFAINVGTVVAAITVFAFGLVALQIWGPWRLSMTTSAGIIAVAIPLLVFLWRFYLAQNRIGWIKAFAINVGTVVAAFVFFIAGGLVVLEIRDWWRLDRDFDPIIYSSRDGLCSVHPSGDSPPYCPGVYLKEPDVSPDGKFIATASATKNERPPFTEIVITNRRGLMVRSLAGSGDFGDPVWSPDGRQIFAISNTLSTPMVIGRWSWPAGEKVVLPVHGLDAGCGRNRHISLSRSGDRAAILCDDQRIYIAEIEQAGMRVLRMLPLSFSHLDNPIWFDGNRLLAVARGAQETSFRLWKIDTESGAALAVPTPGLGLRGSVALSPDRKSMVVTGSSAEAPGWSLWRIDLADSKTTRLTNGDDTNPSWARD